MSRPNRIQYKGACYHVTNKCAGNRPIANCDEHRKMFVDLLAEIHEQFKAEIHAWCLTDDCYHILMTTPLANLSRVMRHLNGVYTQKINRQENTKGALFKGRYKSILVDSMRYLAQVGRRIHLTPQEAKMVDNISEYLWSSYRCYMGLSDTPGWLKTQKTLDMLSDFNGKYESFMDCEEDEIITKFYQKKSLPNVLGCDEFKLKAKQLHKDQNTRTSKQNITAIISKRICKAVADELNVDIKDVYESKRGDTNTARLMAIYLHHVFAQYGQNEIAKIFKFKQAGSVGSSIYRYKKLRQSKPEITAVEAVILTKLKH